MSIFWRAVIVAPFNVVVLPRLGIDQEPSGTFALSLTPTIGMRPPQTFRLRLFPRVIMGQTSTTMGGAITLSVTPFISTTPARGMTLSLTPSFSMDGRARVRGRQYNTAVTRAATH